jgi:hypothetical protein
MPTAIYDSSLLTRRRDDKFVTKSFLSRIQPPLPNFPPQNTTQYGPPTGVYDDSILNKLKNGQPAEYRNGVIIDPAFIPLLQIPNTPTIPPWVTRFIGGGNNELINSCIVGEYIYIIGYFTTNITFYSADQINLVNPSLTITTMGGFTTFIAKYTLNGSLQWATKIENSTTNSNLGYGICSDGNNIYITGYYEISDITLYSANNLLGPTTPSMILPSAGSGSSDIYSAKYNSSGILQWGTTIASASVNRGFSICSDGAGIYVTGFFRNIATFNSATPSLGIPGTPNMTLTSPASLADVFIAKYNNNGILQWATQIGGTKGDIGVNINTNGTDIFVSGNFSADVNCDIYSANTTPLSPPVLQMQFKTTDIPPPQPAGTINQFIVKYNNNGILQWGTRNLGNNTLSNSTFMSMSSTSSHLYVAGFIGESTRLYSAAASYGIPTNPSTLITTSGFYIFIAKYDNNGILQWATKIKYGNTDITGIQKGISLYSNNDSLYITGAYTGDAEIYNVSDQINPSMTLTKIVPFAATNILIAKYDNNGNLIWGNKYGNNTSGGIDLSFTLTSNGSNIYVGGSNEVGTITVYNANGTSSPSVAGSFTNSGISGFLLELTEDGKFNNL